jgi:lipopolysaccharide biosynthesis glycosyltransferase
LNLLFKDCWSKLDKKYNSEPLINQKLVENFEDIHILHFKGPEKKRPGNLKPWHPRNSLHYLWVENYKKFINFNL